MSDAIYGSGTKGSLVELEDDNENSLSSVSFPKNDVGDHFWLNSLGNNVFNNHLIVKKIFSFFDPLEQPIRQFRQINKTTADVIWSLLRQRNSIFLRFGDNVDVNNFRWNLQIIPQLQLLNAIVVMRRPQQIDVVWLIANAAEKIKSLALNITVKTNYSLQILQGLLKNLQNLEELTISLTIQKHFFNQLEFKLESVRKLIWNSSKFSILDSDGKFTRLSEFQVVDFIESFPNVEELEADHPICNHILEHCCFGWWSNLKSLSLKLSDKVSENKVPLELIFDLTIENLQKMKLVGAMGHQDLFVALTEHTNLISLSIVLDTDEVEDFLFLPKFPKLKELELIMRHKFYYPKKQIPMLALDDKGCVCWWSGIFPELERLRIEFPYFKRINSDLFLERMLPTNSQFLKKCPPNNVLKTIELRIPTTKQGNAWIRKFKKNFRIAFKKAELNLSEY